METEFAWEHKSQVIPVLAADLPEHWVHVRGGLRPVFEAAGFTEGHIIGELVARRMQLWRGEKFGSVTELTVLPRWKICTVLFLAGRDSKEWVDGFLDVLEDWARQNGCRYVECHGRSGWARAVGHRGYDVIATSLRKPLDG